MNWNPFKRSRWPKHNNTNPRRHDCLSQCWGHTCRIDNDSKFNITDGPKNERGTYFKCKGHLHPTVRLGDEVIIQFGKGPVVLQFVEVDNCPDPRDMYFATIASLGYLADLEAKETTNQIRPLTQMQQDPDVRERYYSDPEFKKQMDDLK